MPMTHSATVTIVLPYPDADRLVSYWAHEEDNIDFRNDAFRATRCTMSFAAEELAQHLTVAGLADNVVYSAARPHTGLAVELTITDQSSDSHAFDISSNDDTVVITGHSRTGVLYGVYEYLRMLGWQWYAPGKHGNVMPDASANLLPDGGSSHHSPDIPLVRGFDFDAAWVSKDSAELCLWMARNSLNFYTYHPATHNLARKLGMTLRLCGHWLDTLLAPGRILPDGDTMWQAHQDWYGLAPDGTRTKDTAVHTQLCVSNHQSAKYVADTIIERVQNQWKHYDWIDLWGFDTWGNSCHCQTCKDMGNGADLWLHFMSAVRTYLDRAIEENVLEHPLRMVMCAYEGTDTLQGPSLPIPGNLIKAGDIVAFYPINRCYRHSFFDETCDVNHFYALALDQWLTCSPRMPIIFGEYYNVSKFEDLPALYTHTMTADIPAYAARGIEGLTYMHVPMVNWAVRCLTHLLYRTLSWNADTQSDTIISNYFRQWYGPHRRDMQQAYELIEHAYTDISDWRAWSSRSVLSRLLRWNGTMPEHPLASDAGHLSDPDECIRIGHEARDKLQQALDIIRSCQRNEKNRTDASVPTYTDIAVNPRQAAAMQNMQNYEYRLGEDRRLVQYGLDTMRLMTELVAYHDALYRKDMQNSDTQWQEVERIADHMDSYYLPIAYPDYESGIISPDALTRTQLRPLLARCRHRLHISP